MTDWDHACFLSIDTETTGFSKHDRICEIAIVLSEGPRIIETYHTLVNPQRQISDGAMKVHGIKDEDVVDYPTFDQIKDDVLGFLRRDIPWVAHNLAFDARMLSYVIEEDLWPKDVPTLCTLEYAKKKHPVLRYGAAHKLTDLAGGLHLNYDPGMSHNALTDALLLAEIVPVMMRGQSLDTYTKLSHEWLR